MATLKKRIRAGLLRRPLVIDVGSSNTAVAGPQAGALVREPTAVLYAPPRRRRTRRGRPVAAGSGVGRRAGRAAEAAGEGALISPVRRGELEDPEALLTLFRTVLRRARYSRLRARLLGGVVGFVLPGQLNAASRENYLAVLRSEGYGRVQGLDGRMAVAVGSGMDTTAPEGRMVLDLGGGKTAAATHALGGLAAWSWHPIGGQDLDLAVMHHVEQRYRLRLSPQDAERIKCTIGSVYPRHRPQSLDVAGVDARTGLEKKVVVDDNEIRDVLIDACEPLVMAIERGFAAVPPELAGDIAAGGVTLAGGGALLAGLPEFLAERTGLTFRPAADPINATIRGALALLMQELGA